MPDRLSSFERVTTAVRHAQPDRVPFSWGFGPTPEMAAVLTRELAPRGLDWPVLRATADDLVRCGWPQQISGPPPMNPDIWGIRRAVTTYGNGAYDEIVHYPLAGVETVAELQRYPWPCPEACDVSSIQAYHDRENPGHRKAFLMQGGNPFEIYCWMTGLEEAIVNLLERPEVVIYALARITGYFATVLARTLQYCGAVVDLIFFADDLGSQTSLLISRTMYRELLMPFHRRLTACAAELAPHAARMVHSDGAVFDILPELIDAGFTVFEAVQTDAAGMDPQRLKDAYGNALAFHGGISVQQLLPLADAATVRAETARLAAIFNAGGGYIAAPAHAIQLGTPVDNVLAMLEGVLGAERYAELLHDVRQASG